MSLRRRAAVAALIALSISACGGDKTAAIPIETVAVERRDITVNAEATGLVEPINVVEVKSKASGQVTEMPVDVGSMVSAGQLLVQIDTRDVKNNYDQAIAALRAAQAKLDVSTAQKKRSDELFAQEVITAQEHETATLDYANAQAAAVKARTDADLARQRLEDATVRAPIAGTVIEKPVSQGQVITSATSGPTGGTTLLKMADLSRVRMRTLVNETDIGNVKPGQPATVVVDAFPDRRFRGTVEKVEPQAVVQQSVTTFPVLISLDNSDRQLMPGMNGQVTMLIEQREDVLAVPADAIRTMRELPTVARALGLDPEKTQTEVRAQLAAARGGAARRTDSATGAIASNGNGGGAAPVNGAGGQGAGEQRTMRRSRGGNTGGAGVPAAPQQGDAGVQLPLGGGGGGAGAARSAAVVFIKDANGAFAPRAVRTGVTDFDYTEVIGGVKEGDQVALLGSAVLQQQRADQNDRIRSAQSGALTGGAPAGGGGGGGGRRP